MKLRDWRILMFAQTVVVSCLVLHTIVAFATQAQIQATGSCTPHPPVQNLTLYPFATIEGIPDRVYVRRAPNDFNSQGPFKCHIHWSPDGPVTVTKLDYPLTWTEFVFIFSMAVLVWSHYPGKPPEIATQASQVKRYDGEVCTVRVEGGAGGDGAGDDERRHFECRGVLHLLTYDYGRFSIQVADGRHCLLLDFNGDVLERARLGADAMMQAPLTFSVVWRSWDNSLWSLVGLAR